MNISKIKYITFILMMIACSSNIRKNMGLYNDSPNEFNILSNPPLSIPPIDLTKDSNFINKYDLKSQKNRYKKNNSSMTKGEKLFLDKIYISDEDIKNIIHKKDKIIKKKGFFSSLFVKKNKYAKDSTQDPEADESERTYRHKPIQSMDSINANRRICNIHNGEIIYCDKNTFIKNFSIPTK